MLVKQAETLSESTSLAHEGVEYDALLFSAPLVAWTRYQLPQGELTAEQITALVTQMQASVVAPDAHLAIVPRLINFDQMPQTFQETRSCIQHLSQQALPITDRKSLREGKSVYFLLN